MRHESFAETLRKRSGCHEIWQHPYFKREPSLELIKKWLLQAGPFEERYPEFLRMMLNNPAIPNSCYPVISQNLEDELGNGNPKAAHFKLFRDALEAVGIPLQAYEQAFRNPSTLATLKKMSEVCSGTNPVAALTFVSQVELFTPPEYEQIQKWMASTLPESREQWEPYFKVHIGCDDHHFEEMVTALETVVCGDHALRREAFLWQTRGLELDKRFYDELHQT